MSYLARRENAGERLWAVPAAKEEPNEPVADIGQKECDIVTLEHGKSR